MVAGAVQKATVRRRGILLCFMGKKFMQKDHREENKQAGTRRHQLVTTSHFNHDGEG